MLLLWSSNGNGSIIGLVASLASFILKRPFQATWLLDKRTRNFIVVLTLGPLYILFSTFCCWCTMLQAGWMVLTCQFVLHWMEWIFLALCAPSFPMMHTSILLAKQNSAWVLMKSFCQGYFVVKKHFSDLHSLVEEFQILHEMKRIIQCGCFE